MRQKVRLLKPSVLISEQVKKLVHYHAKSNETNFQPSLTNFSKSHFMQISDHFA